MKNFVSISLAIILSVCLAVSALAVEVGYTDGKTPSYSYTVIGDVTEITATVTILDFITADAEGIIAADYWKDGVVQDGAGWNDWCGEIIIVTAPDGTVSYYDWGGSQVTWGADVDGDGNNDVFGNNFKSESWLGEVGVGQTVDLVIPVSGAGTVIDFIVNSWDTYDGNQFDIAISGDAEAPAVEETPDEETPAEETPAVEETPADETPAVEETPADTTEEPADTGLALAVVPMVAAMAAVALSKKR